MPDDTPSSPSPVVIDRADNYTTLYANSVIFEGNAWDLKIRFGQIELVGTETHIKVLTEISIPWSQAKLGTYWLRLQVEAMEIQSGKIAIRKDVLPPPPPTPDEADQDSVKMHEFAVKARSDFLASL